MLSLLFLAKPTGFFLNKCVLWLQSRSCFRANLCYLTLSSVHWNQGLNFFMFYFICHIIITKNTGKEEKKKWRGDLTETIGTYERLGLLEL